MITSPNMWSCLPCAFANALTDLGTPTTLEDILDFVGHDGSRILYPRREYGQIAFHTQEMVDYCYSIGYAVIEVIPFPLHDNGESEPQHTIMFKDTHQERLMKYLKKEDGVLIGQLTHGVRHAVSYVTNQIKCSSNGHVTFDNFAISHFEILRKIK